MTPPLLEVIVTTAADAVAAREGGAGRVELVAQPGRGGMTPPIRTVEEVVRVDIPVRVIVRATESHEVTDPAVRDALIHSAREIGALGVDGIVAGGLRQGTVDAGLLEALAGASGCRITFHRAIEDVSDPRGAMATLRRLQVVDRVLSSGGPGTWDTRLGTLTQLAELGAPDITVIAGGGLTLDDVRRLAGVAAIREVHVGRLAREGTDPARPVSAREVRALVRTLGG